MLDVSLSNRSRAARRAVFSGALVALTSALVGVGCGDSGMPADVVSDRRAPDASTAMDAAVADTTPPPPPPADAEPPPMDTMPPPPPMDVAPPPADVPPSTACCRAFSPGNQGMCDALESAGADRCNMFNDGTVCSWSPEPRCADAGAPPVDAGPPPNCCLAISPANAAICSALSPFGRDRCNRLDGGGTCIWSSAMVCNTAPPPVDAGSPMDAASDARADSSADARTDAAPDVRDSGPDVVDAGIPGCCLARTGSRGTVCRTYTTTATCNAQVANTCVWVTSTQCTNPLGTNGACCIAATSALYTATCAGLSTLSTCRANVRCAWRCP